MLLAVVLYHHPSDNHLEQKRTMTRTVSRTIALLGIVGSTTVSAAVINIDGKLADWGVNKSTWVPADATANGIQFTIDDQTGRGNYRLGPGWGGQAYDAEALYAKKSGEVLYIALVTGHNPRTLNQPSKNSYGAGDFAIDFGRNGIYDLGINIQHATSVSSSGVYSFESFGVEGGVYKDPKWAYGLWDRDGNYTDPGSSSYNPDLAHPTHLTDGTWVGDVSGLFYSQTAVTGYGSNQNDLHYIYEMSVDLALLRKAGWIDGQAFDIHWTQNCANDSIFVDPPGSVPEPGTLALIGLSVFGLVVARRKKAAS